MAADDLELLVSLVLDGSDPRANAALAQLVAAVGPAGRRAGGEIADETGSAFAKALKAQMEKGARQAADAAFAKIRESGGSAASATKAALRAQERAYSAGYQAINSVVDKGARRVNQTQREAAQSARNAERQASQQILLAQRSGSAQALEAARAANRERLAGVRQAEAQRLEANRAGNRIDYTETQASEARKTALVKAGLRTLTSTYEAGLKGVLSVVRSAGNAIVERQKANNEKATSETKVTLERQTSVIRSQLDEQGAVYSRAAAKRLTQIEREASSETRVIKESAVRQAQARASAASATSGGVLGAATGTSGLGATLQYAASAVGGTLLLRQISAITAESIKVSQQTNAVIKSTRGVANESASALDDYARRLSKVVGIQHNAIQQGANVLLTFTAIRNGLGAGNDIFNQTLKVALDVSSALKKNLQPTIIQIGKALNDPVRGLSGLRRIGVQVTDQLSDEVKKMVAQNNLLGAQKLILKELNTEFGGVAATQALAGDRLRVTLHNVEENIGLFARRTLLPIGLAIGGFLANLAEGGGAWKITRDGLLGVAAALGAMLAVKAGAEVLGLVQKYLALLAASPTAIFVTALAGLAGVLYSLYKNNAAVKGFFDGLVKGTEGWFKVGYKLDHATNTLSNLVDIQSSLGAAARTAHDFFSALITGTEGWVKVGYKRGGPTDTLSNIVLAQSTVGAAARQIVTSLGDITKAVSDLFSGHYEDAIQSLGNIGGRLGKAFGPLGKQIALGLSNAVGAGGDFLGALIGDPSKDATAAVRFGERVRKIVVHGLDTARHDVSEFFGGALFGVGTSSGDNSTARRLGDRITTDLQSAFRIAKRNAGDFLSGLFTGIKPVDLTKGLFSNLTGSGAATASGATKVGDTVRRFIGRIFGDVQTIAAPVGRFLGAVGSAVGDFITNTVVPKLVRVPYIIGKFLSRTLFSEGFLTALKNVAVGLGAAAIIIGGQFILGVLKGIEQRKGDIAKVLGKTLVQIVKLALASGPFGIIGLALAGVFVGSKIVGAISKFSTYSKAALLGLQGDARGAQTALNGVQKVLYDASGAPILSKTTGGGSGLTNFALSAHKALDGIGKIPGALDAASGAIGSFGQKLQSKANIADILAGESPNGSLKSRLLTSYAGALDAVGSRLTSFDDFLVRNTTGTFDKVKSVASNAYQKIGGLSGTVTTLATTAAGALSGYFLGASNDLVSMATAGIGVLGSVSAQLATGNTVGAAITGFGALVGFVLGRNAKAAADARKKLADQAALVKQIGNSVASSFRDAFDNLGGTGAAERAQATLQVLQDAVKNDTAGSRDFYDKLRGSVKGLTNAAASGAPAVKKYVDALTDAQTAKVISGNSDALHRFSQVANDAARDATKRLRQQASDSQYYGGSTSEEDQGKKIADLSDKLEQGKLTWGQYADALRKAKVPLDQIREATDRYKRDVATGVQDSAGSIFGVQVSKKLAETIRDEQKLADINDRIAAANDKNRSAADLYTESFDRQRTAIDLTKTAYSDYLTTIDGGKTTLAQARLDVTSAATDLASDDPHAADFADKKTLAIAQAQAALGDSIAQIAKESSGNVDTFRSKLSALTDDLYKRVLPAFHGNTQEAHDFVSQVTKLPTNVITNLLLKSDPAVKSYKDVKAKLLDYIRTNPTTQLKLNTESAEGKRKTIAKALAALSKSDPAVSLYLHSGHYRSSLDAAKKHLSDFTTSDHTVIVGVKIKPPVVDPNTRSGAQSVLDKANASLADIKKKHGTPAQLEKAVEAVAAAQRQLDGVIYLHAGALAAAQKTYNSVRRDLGKDIKTGDLKGKTLDQLRDLIAKAQTLQVILASLRDTGGNPFAAATAIRNGPPAANSLAKLPSAKQPFVAPKSHSLDSVNIGAQPGGITYLHEQNIYETQNPRVTGIEAARQTKSTLFRTGRLITPNAAIPAPVGGLR